MSNSSLQQAPLGQAVSYPKHYDASVLFPIERANNRRHLNIPIEWHGADIWNAYELSWLNARGKPIVATASYTVPQDSPRLVESKSFKLYLNSFNETAFNSVQDVVETMRRDLSQTVGAPVDVAIQPLGEDDRHSCHPLDGDNIDGLDIEIQRYEPAPDLLALAPQGEVVTETLVSDLLKSNCPVTGQPDWGSVQVRYTGQQIDRESLLRYIVSLRRHTEFHEHCVEKMFCDIWHACRPQELSVYARYTRRGGLDINPWRSSHPTAPANHRTIRQ